MEGGWSCLTGDAQAIHGRLSSGIHASTNPIQATPSTSHSPTAVFLTRVVQKQNQEIRKKTSKTKSRAIGFDSTYASETPSFSLDFLNPNCRNGRKADI